MSQTCSIAKSVVPCAEVFPVHQAMNELEARLEELRQLTQELAKRLLCVMCPAEPIPMKENPGPVPIEHCSLMESLDGRIITVRELIDQVGIVLKRLEV